MSAGRIAALAAALLAAGCATQPELAPAMPERTAAQFGALGEVRRDPMAMLPFCGYNMADYFGHWLDMGTRIRFKPRIFHANWFRTDENGKFLWPGFGENLRVLEWILARCRGEVDAFKTAIGYIPNTKDIDMTGLEMPQNKLEKLFEIDPKAWEAEMGDVSEFFKQFGPRLPLELWAQHEALKRRLQELGGAKT
jgi:phosphoenolpyruvate carboxykinase (GTP)